jgi:hypothetical protein
MPMHGDAFLSRLPSQATSAIHLDGVKSCFVLSLFSFLLLKGTDRMYFPLISGFDGGRPARYGQQGVMLIHPGRLQHSFMVCFHRDGQFFVVRILPLYLCPYLLFGVRTCFCMQLHDDLPQHDFAQLLTYFQLVILSKIGYVRAWGWCIYVLCCC